MLQFITSVTPLQWREIAPFVRSLIVERAPDDSPTWASTIIRGRAEDITSLVGMFSRMGHRFEGWRPKPVIVDPTFAMAAARIDRPEGGAAPAQVTLW